MGNSFWNSVLNTLDLSSDFRLKRSSASLVESKFGDKPLRTLIAATLKFPSRFFGNLYPFVGGWEVVIRHDA
jgi:hypothetical protein